MEWRQRLSSSDSDWPSNIVSNETASEPNHRAIGLAASHMIAMSANVIPSMTVNAVRMFSSIRFLGYRGACVALQGKLGKAIGVRQSSSTLDIRSADVAPDMRTLFRFSCQPDHAFRALLGKLVLAV